MPEQETVPGGERHRALRIADEFVEGLAFVYSERVLDQIRHVLGLLESSPEIGSPLVRPSLTKRYGDGLRKVPVSTFVIVYRIADETVDVLALVYGPRVR